MQYFPFFGSLEIFISPCLISYLFWISFVAVLIILLIRRKT